MHDLARRTTCEAREDLTARTIAILPIGSTEPHGPHLPLDTDVTIALAQSNRAARQLDELGVRALVLPPIAYGVTNYTQGFAGRITLRPGTLWALVEDLINALEQEGVRQIVLVNGHLEPAHVQVLRGVVLDHAERNEQRAQAVFADVTRRRFAERLGEEFKSGDCHAGSYETSIVLHAAPETVQRPLLSTLPRVRIDLIAKMKAGASTFVEAGAIDGYCGDPRASSAEEGRDLVERLASIVVDLARETWPELFAR